MQAVILVGGEGTRLRPLTSTVPKPVVPLVDRPFIAYMLEWLRGHGVDDVVMSCGFLASGVRNVLGDGSGLGIELRYVEETGARATLALIGVDDPSAYGLVRLNEDRSVKEFLEKPSPDQIDTNLISAGAYVLQRDVLDLIRPDSNASIERDVFPEPVGDGLYGFAGDGYWLDIGTPDRYLQATFDILERNVKTVVGDDLGDNYLSVAGDASFNGRVVPPARVGRGCRIAGDARVGSLAVLGDNVRVGEGTTIERAVVFNGADIGPNCQL